MRLAWSKWTDYVTLGGSLLLVVASVWWMNQNGVFNFVLYEDEKLAWHLIRSSGIVAYMLLLASTIWGLFVSSQLVKGWSPGPISMTLHSTVSWLALLLGLLHGLLLLFDDYFTYSLGDILLPFSGPYKPEFVGLGTLAFWLLFGIAISFPLRKWIGHKLWQNLHYLSYLAYAMVSVHGLFAGTDGHVTGFQLITGGGIVTVLVLLGIRLRKDRHLAPKERLSKAH